MELNSHKKKVMNMDTSRYTCKHKEALSVILSNINATIMKELIDGQNNDTFCCTMLILINDRKVPLDKYYICDNGLLYKVVREDDKLFHIQEVPITSVNVYCNKWMIHKVSMLLLEPINVWSDYIIGRDYVKIFIFMWNNVLSSDNSICTLSIMHNCT